MFQIQKLNKPLQPKKNLLCFHWVGGNGNGFRDLAKKVEKEQIQVIAITLPDRNLKKLQTTKLKSVKDIIQNILILLEKKKEEFQLLQLPLYMFGHSFGGLIAYELSRVFTLCKIEKLILSAIKNPRDVTEFNSNPTSELHHIQSDQELFYYIKSFGGLREGVDEAFLWMALPTIKSDYALFERYSHEGDNPSKVIVDTVLFLGEKDVAVGMTSMQGWNDFIQCNTDPTASIELRVFKDGDHFYFTQSGLNFEFAVAITTVLCC